MADGRFVVHLGARSCRVVLVQGTSRRPLVQLMALLHCQRPFSDSDLIDPAPWIIKKLCGQVAHLSDRVIRVVGRNPRLGALTDKIMQKCQLPMA